MPSIKTPNSNPSSKKILIIRFSSFGDIIQILPTIDLLSNQGHKVDFLTKKEFKHCIEIHPSLSEKIYFDKNKSLFSELRKINALLLQKRYDYIYDAHNNLRTFLIRGFSFWIRTYGCLRWKKLCWIRRSKNRFRRFLFFNLKFKSLFKFPYIAAHHYIYPLKNQFPLSPHDLKLLNPNPKYLENIQDDQSLKFNLPSNFICLAPSAAWPLKRWPLEFFQKLTKVHPEVSFVVIGGPQDEFAKALKGQNITNLVGDLDWSQTGWVLKHSQALISGDTGVLHWADYMGTPCIGIFGPTAFGHTFRKTSYILNLKLPCSPCSKDGRGDCKIKVTQKCLTHIQPEDVSLKLKEMKLL